jgi:hypothetical protein
MAKGILLMLNETVFCSCTDHPIHMSLLQICELKKGYLPNTNLVKMRMVISTYGFS